MTTKATMSPERLRAESQARVRLALNHIQEAQNHLGHACSALSSLNGGHKVQQSTSKLYDRVHTLWYQVEGFRMRGRFELDDTNVDGILKREAQAALNALSQPGDETVVNLCNCPKQPGLHPPHDDNPYEEGMGGDAILDRNIP